MKDGCGKYYLRKALSTLLPLPAFNVQQKLAKPGNTLDLLFSSKPVHDLIIAYRADYVDPSLYSIYSDAFHKLSCGYKKNQIENWNVAVQASCILSRVLMTQLAYLAPR